MQELNNYNMIGRTSQTVTTRRCKQRKQVCVPCEKKAQNLLNTFKVVAELYEKISLCQTNSKKCFFPLKLSEENILKISKRLGEPKKLRETSHRAKVRKRRDTGYRLEHNDKEIIPEYREELEVKIKYKFIWALDEAAVTEMTKVVKDNDPNKLNINQLYSLFEHLIIHKRNIFHSEPTSSVLYGNQTKERKTYG